MITIFTSNCMYAQSENNSSSKSLYESTKDAIITIKDAYNEISNSSGNNNQNIETSREPDLNENQKNQIDKNILNNIEERNQWKEEKDAEDRKEFNKDLD